MPATRVRADAATERSFTVQPAPPSGRGAPAPEPSGKRHGPSIGEITDVALDAQAARPGFTGVQHGIIDPDREQNCRLARSLFIQCPRHFVLNPIAGNRVFGQDQQHLVAQPDRLVDGVDDPGADRHIVRREPAPHALVLEISVEAVGELLVLARIADEAGKELDRLVQQRGQVIDAGCRADQHRAGRLGAADQSFAGFDGR
jgi:hypothetical protein